MTRLFNFSSGPAVLPEPVLKRAQEALWDLDGTGIGILEHSHRGAAFEAVLARTEERARRIAGIPDSHAVLFLQGGATWQFTMVPMSFLGGGTADFCDTGSWSRKAIAEAKRYGTAHVASKDMSEPRWSERAVYAHYCSNETIHGVQYAAPPEPPPGVPLVSDMSSDIFSRPFDVARHALIYAGAQKNLGPSGVTMVIVDKAFAERGATDLPAMLQYRTFIAERSMINTPPTFGIYVIGEVLAWLEEQGGLPAIAELGAAKAKLLYDFLDESELFRGLAPREHRSRMNVTFTTGDAARDARFAEHAARQGLDGLPGHRSVGGLRASLYNAFPIEGVRALVACMKDFERAETRD